MYVPSLTWCNSVAISEQNQKTVGTNRMKLTPPHLAEKQMLLYENMRPLAILCDLVGMGKMLPFQRWCSELPGSSRIESPSREGSCDFKTTWRIIHDLLVGIMVIVGLVVIFITYKLGAHPPSTPQCRASPGNSQPCFWDL